MMGTGGSMSKVKSPFLVNTFGNEILEKGFTAVPNVILDCQRELKLTDNEILFFIKTYRMNGRRVSEKELGMKSKHTTMWRMKRNLKNKGYLETQEIYTHSENKKIKCLGTVFNWSGLINHVGLILKEQVNKEVLPFQNEIARSQIETAPAQIEIADAKLEQSLKTSSKTLSKTFEDNAIAENENSIQFEPKQDPQPESHPNPKQSLVPGAAKSKTDGELLWDSLYAKDKSIGMLPLDSDAGGKVIYFKQGKVKAESIVKEDGLQAALEVFKFAYGNKYCQPVRIGYYKTYKARYMAEHGGTGETIDERNARLIAKRQRQREERENQK